MRLLAISDLHLSNAANRRALSDLPAHPGDWLILGGDVGERLAHVRLGFIEATNRFERVIWVPGNHELWSVPDEDDTAPPLSGQARYDALVALARAHGVLTPEDPYPLWDGPGGPCIVAPLFVHYDYSFRDADVTREAVVPWAQSGGAVCADEMLLHPEPYGTNDAWCAARLRLTEARLGALNPAVPTVLVNHYPLRRDLIHIPRVPRFVPWCGTRHTEDWHRRFNARVVVTGHLHTRRTDWRDGTRFEEVSLGYPRQWDQSRGMVPYLREILPGPDGPPG